MPNLITTPSTPPSRLEELRRRFAVAKLKHTVASVNEDDLGEAIPFGVIRELSRAKQLLSAEESRLARLKKQPGTAPAARPGALAG